MPDAVDARLAELEAALAAFEDPPVQFDPADVAMAGVFISIGAEGRLLIQRGYVRRGDERPEASASGSEGNAGEGSSRATEGAETGAAHHEGTSQAPDDGDDATGAEDDEGLRPLSDRLVIELTAIALSRCATP